MFVLFSTLDEHGYNEVKPFVEKVEKARMKDLENEKKWRNLPGLGINSQDLLPEEVDTIIEYEKAQENASENDEVSQTTFDLYTIATKYAKRNVEIGEDEDKFQALEDVHDALEDMNEDARLFFDELDNSIVIPITKLPDILKKYTSIVSAIDFETFIAKKAYNADRIPIDIYKDVLKTEMDTLSYAVKNGFSLLILYVFD